MKRRTLILGLLGGLTVTAIAGQKLLFSERAVASEPGVKAEQCDSCDARHKSMIKAAKKRKKSNEINQVISQQ